MKFTKLRYFRREKKMNAGEMANLLGLKTSSAYTKKEDGQVRITIEEAKVLCDFFEMTVEDLFFEDIERIERNNEA